MLLIALFIRCFHPNSHSIKLPVVFVFAQTCTNSSQTHFLAHSTLHRLFPRFFKLNLQANQTSDCSPKTLINKEGIEMDRLTIKEEIIVIQV